MKSQEGFFEPRSSCNELSSSGDAQRNKVRRSVLAVPLAFSIQWMKHNSSVSYLSLCAQKSDVHADTCAKLADFVPVTTGIGNGRRISPAPPNS